MKPDPSLRIVKGKKRPGLWVAVLDPSFAIAHDQDEGAIRSLALDALVPYKQEGAFASRLFYHSQWLVRGARQGLLSGEIIAAS